MIKYILLSISLTVLNLLIWAIATGTYVVWTFASSESKNLFMVWMSLCLIIPVIVGFVVSFVENKDI